MKLPKIVRILFLIVIVASGILMTSIGYTVPLEEQLNTALFYLGICLFLIGAGEFASLVDSFSEKTDNITGQKMLSQAERQLSICLIILRFLPFRITTNIQRLYLDFELDSGNILLTAFYEVNPSEVELRLLDDIVINAASRIHDFSLENKFKLMRDLTSSEKHDFTVFATYNQ